MNDKTVRVERDGKSLTVSYTDQLAQDLKEVHGIDISIELEKILQEEFDKEFIREAQEKLKNESQAPTLPYL